MPENEALKKGRLIGEVFISKTPMLRADATDDVIEDVTGVGESGTEYTFAEGGTVSAGDLGGSVVTPSALVCPICGLESCGHNLPLVPKEQD